MKCSPNTATRDGAKLKFIFITECTSPIPPRTHGVSLTEFRDQLAFRHRCLSVEDGSTDPRYAFVHGNFALANSAGGLFCGVDSEMQILAETGCYADLTMPAALVASGADRESEFRL